MFVLNKDEHIFDPLTYNSFIDGFNELYKTVCSQFPISIFSDKIFLDKLKTSFIEDSSNLYVTMTCREIIREIYIIDTDDFYLEDSYKKILYDLRDLFNSGVNKESLCYEYKGITFISVDCEL